LRVNFEQSLNHLLASEGGYQDDPLDSGNLLPDGRKGCTNWGVTQAAWESYLGHKVSNADMRNLTKDKVSEFYRHKYWDSCKCDLLPNGIDYLVFDFAVNSGSGTAIKRLQESVGTTPDGAIGPRTMQALNTTSLVELIDRYSQAKRLYYESLKSFPRFGKGWLNRVTETKRIALGMII
jgi:lysozyme family protein